MFSLAPESHSLTFVIHAKTGRCSSSPLACQLGIAQCSDVQECLRQKVMHLFENSYSFSLLFQKTASVHSQHSQNGKQLNGGEFHLVADGIAVCTVRHFGT